MNTPEPSTRLAPASRGGRRHILRVAALGVVAVAIVACGGAAATQSPLAGGSSAAPSAAAATSQPAATSGASAATAATPAPAGSSATGSLPADPCSVVTAGDVQGAFGGTVSSDGVKEDACQFEITGAMTAGKPDSPFLVRVGFGAKFTPFDTMHATMGDAVTKVDSLGTPAWIALGVIHAQVAGGALEVAAIGIGTFDRATLGTEGLTLTKTVLGHL